MIVFNNNFLSDTLPSQIMRTVPSWDALSVPPSSLFCLNVQSIPSFDWNLIFISGEFSKIDTASFIVVIPGVIFCQQDGLQTGWASHEVHQFGEISGVINGVGVLVLALSHDTLKIINNPLHTNNLTFLFMAHLPGERVWSELV